VVAFRVKNAGKNVIDSLVRLSVRYVCGRNYDRPNFLLPSEDNPDLRLWHRHNNERLGIRQNLRGPEGKVGEAFLVEFLVQ
jgi:hypothetical protein